MPNIRNIKQAFTGGEVAPELFGRYDLEKFGQSVEKMRNFIALPHGPAINRPGTRFVSQTKNNSFKCRLIPFNFSATQTFAIELGAGYFRFYTLGGRLESSPGVAYEVANSYLQADIDSFRIKYAQSGDVVTFTHPSYPPSELRRITNLNWTFTTISFNPLTVAPASCTAVATYPTAGVSKNYTYRCTALNTLGYEESLASPVSNNVVNDLTITGNFNTISWPVVAGAIRYNVYKYASGTYGFIGQTAALTFVDDNILADTARTIPFIDPIFASANNYPSCVGYYEQRRFFANTNNEPTNVWATQSSSDNNMAYSIPSQDSDALRFRIIGKSNGVRHISGLQDLIFLTASTEWRINSQNDSALTPSTIAIKAQSQNGASDVIPVQVNNYLLYEQAQGGHIREMTYQWQTQAYDSNDISLLSPHLFNNYRINDMGFARAPFPILWATSTSGNLLGLTYVPEQKVSGWHMQTTDGVIESVCVVTENQEDKVYMVVQRTINAVVRRYIELLGSLSDFPDIKDSYYVDCGLTYTGVPANSFSGLSHLEGKTVAILGDGVVQPQQVVVGGSITIPVEVSKAHIGLPIPNVTLKTLPIAFQDPTGGQTHVKNVNKVYVRVANSGIFDAGPSETKLTPIKYSAFSALVPYTELQTGEFELAIDPLFAQAGQVVVSQSSPLPLKIVYVGMEVAIGG
jgi:hypothetical protein